MKLFAGKTKSALTLVAATILALGTLTACNKETTQAQASTTQTTQAQTANNQTKEGDQSVTATAEDLKNVSELAILVVNDLKTQLNLTDDELKAFAEGVQKFVSGSATELNQEQAQALTTYLNARAQKVMLDNLAVQAEANGKAGKEAMEKFAKDHPNAVKDESGIIYVIENQGKGEKIRATDTVKVKYKGSFVDGRVFDENQEGVEFPLNGVIPGFSEAITKLNVGGKILVLIPPQLAYGERGNQAIPPRSTLQFEIEVLSAKPEASTAPASK
ncbi:FKBP-type peptidyl-prolyl cis-trans isomerase [Psittacicella gerlachiana]|uniref:Peptidyl-prolyl cis-trans isomerase n=1 Tax=Psittacicella gerlachiana TaxID=2028574 RepID=A0A3A1Y7N0_9GAMM|nr:FKBP-type peptidyl-prolyl cis-trans isomerase [Psittacicella gerlachiana]RIY34303.1 hypothetical protein CKF59_05635 [Psittacicella gerlachiana]